MPFLTTEAASAPPARVTFFLPEFDDLPFLATKIEDHLFHVEILPREWPLYALMDLGGRQARSNSLPTHVVLDKVSSLSFMPDGVVYAAEVSCCPTGMVTGCLALADNMPLTRPEMRSPDDYLERMTALVRALSGQSPNLAPSLFKGGRTATSDEVENLSGKQWNGVPLGLEQCADCEEWFGRCLDDGWDSGPLIVPVYCRCAPPNRCAYCGRPFHERRLCGNRYDLGTGELVYVPGTIALKHRCTGDEN